MSIKTKIQWCDSTCNPTMGCDGCELWNKNRKTCYAGILHRRFGGHTNGYAPTFEDVTEYPGRMEKASRWKDLSGLDRPEKPWLNKLPRLIFVSDMSDSLSKSVTFEYLEQEIINIVESDRGRRHHWLWLTKVPKRMAKFSDWLSSKRQRDWPSNLWAGTSITTQTTAGRAGDLLGVGNDETVRFLSVEPQWKAIDLSEWLPNLSWIIQGGESGVSAVTFQMEWARDLIAQCAKHKVPYFLKQLGEKVAEGGHPVETDDTHGGDWDEWPRDLRVRQFPITPRGTAARKRRTSKSGK